MWFGEGYMCNLVEPSSLSGARPHCQRVADYGYSHHRRA